MAVFTSHGLRLRWLNAQCFEFEFPNGRRLLTDPFYRWDGDPEDPIIHMTPKEQFYARDFGHIDYVFINHTHGDHMLNLQEVIDEYQPQVICHSACAMEVAKTFNIRLTSIYPADYGSTAYFDGFKMEFVHGTHHSQPFNLRQRMEDKKVQYVGAEKMDLAAMGGIFNMNFILTTAEGFRIAFIGGNDDGMIERLHDQVPNLIIRNKMAPSTETDNAALRWAENHVQTKAPLMIPMHYETWRNLKPDYLKQVFADMDAYYRESGSICRLAPIESGKWYSLDLSLTPITE